MIPYTDLHIHTDFSDGAASPEQMVQAAIDKGLDTIGFSDHSPLSYDDYAMSAKKLPEYKSHIRALREKYRGKINIMLGIENDSSEPIPTADFDYSIASVHALRLGEEFISIDYKELDTAIAACGGDAMRLVRMYYDDVVRMARDTRPDIVGHFDIIVMLNSNNRYFNEDSEEYKNTALAALRETVKYCDLFEINTGGMAKGIRTAPYPAPFLLCELCRLGGRVILSSDAHCAKDIIYSFDDAFSLAKECGFKKITVPRDGKFIEIDI